MLGLVVGICVLLFIAYATYVLFFNLDEEVGTSLEDFILDRPDKEDSTQTYAHNKYLTKYDEPGKQVLVLYGTEYGFSEEVAKKLFDRLADGENYQELSLQPRVLNSKDFELIDFSQEQVVLCVFSTTGDGVPPTESRSFFDLLNASDKAPPISHIQYSVLALGDYNYPHFCRAGKILDSRLSELGAKCLYNRVDVDLEDWSLINKWMDAVLDSLIKLDLETRMDYLDLSNQVEESGYSRTRPFKARMTVKYNLTASDVASDKETLHAEFDLTDSDLSYTSGDALGIYPLNNPPEVDTLITALHSSDDHQVAVPPFCYSPKPEGDKISLRDALTKYYDLKTVKLDLVQLVVSTSTNREQKEKGQKLLKDGLSRQNQSLSSYLSDHEVLDVLQDFSSYQCSVQDILTQLRPLQPRYYSIASSPKKDSNSVSVCAAVIRYTLQDEPRTGVCTTFIQDRLDVDQYCCPVFISQNPDFRLPASRDVHVIMIGPGTGIAPFRAFLQERELLDGKGKNLLYFGCRHKNKDFLYKDELERWVSNGILQLQTAFSRDQPQKIYVQNLIAQDKEILWELINDGAHIYVCGDALHMAGDVHEALLQVLESKGKLSRSEAEQYMEKLENTSRYQRDVWVT